MKTENKLCLYIKDAWVKQGEIGRLNIYSFHDKSFSKEQIIGIESSTHIIGMSLWNFFLEAADEKL